MDINVPLTCPACQRPVQPLDFFCANCGKKLKEQPLSTGVAKQIHVYLVSIFLPPFGIWPGVKYLSQNDQKSRTIGMIAIGLTVLSTIVSTWYLVEFFNNVNTTINKEFNSQELPGLGT